MSDHIGIKLRITSFEHDFYYYIITIHKKTLLLTNKNKTTLIVIKLNLTGHRFQ